jgi:hypothetical protein
MCMFTFNCVLKFAFACELAFIASAKCALRALSAFVRDVNAYLRYGQSLTRHIELVRSIASLLRVGSS